MLDWNPHVLTPDSELLLAAVPQLWIITLIIPSILIIIVPILELPKLIADPPITLSNNGAEGSGPERLSSLVQ